MIQCYNCNTLNAPGTRFCTSCGEKFTYQCPRCNAEVEWGSNYCLTCNMQLNWGVSPGQPDQKLTGLFNQTSDIDVLQQKKVVRTNTWLIAFVIVVLLIIILFIVDAIF